MANLSRPFQFRATRGSSGSDLSRDIGYDYRRTVGRHVRDWRLAKGLTQEQLAQQMGMGFTAVSAIETGRGAVPPERYEDFAAILGVPRREFGKFMLRYTNPWAYAMIFEEEAHADPQLRRDLQAIPERLGVNIATGRPTGRARNASNEHEGPSGRE